MAVSSLLHVPGGHIVSLPITALTAGGGDVSTFLTFFPVGARVARVWLVTSGAGITGANVNNRVLRIRFGTTDMFALEFSLGVNVTLGAVTTLSAFSSAVSSKVKASAGTVINYLSDEQGTGMAFPAGTLKVEFNLGGS